MRGSPCRGRKHSDGAQPQRRERRQAQGGRPRFTVRGHGFGPHGAVVAARWCRTARHRCSSVRATVRARAGRRDSRARHRREVADGDHRRPASSRRANANTLLSRSSPISQENPAAWQSSACSAGSAAYVRFRSRTSRCAPAMRGRIEQVPVRRRVVRELGPLREFAAHEQQLLAGVRPHEAEVRAQRREPLPRVARHLRDERLCRARPRRATAAARSARRTRTRFPNVIRSW